MAFQENQVPPPPPPQWPEASPPPPPEYQQRGPTFGFYPLTIGRTVSVAFSMFRFGWRTFAGITVLAAIPVVAFQVPATLVSYQAMADWQQQVMDALRSSQLTNPPSASVSIADFPFQAIALTLVVSLLLGAITAVASGALIHAIAVAIAGGRLSIRESYRAAFGRLKDLLVMYVVVTAFGLGVSLLAVLGPALTLGTAGSLGGGGAIAFVALLVGVAVVFLSVFLVIRFTFTLPALMVEQLSATAALRRSYRLVAGSMWRVVGYLFVFGLLLGLIGLAISLVALVLSLVIAPINLTAVPLTFNPLGIAVQTVTTNLLAEIFTPIITIGLVLLYFDVRWRHGETVPVPGGGETTGPPVLAPR